MPADPERQSPDAVIIRIYDTRDLVDQAVPSRPPRSGGGARYGNSSRATPLVANLFGFGQTSITVSGADGTKAEETQALLDLFNRSFRTQGFSTCWRGRLVVGRPAGEQSVIEEWLRALRRGGRDAASMPGPLLVKPAPPPAPPSADHDADALNDNVGHLQFHDAPLDAVLGELSRRAHLAIVPDWNEIFDFGANTDTPITCDCSGLTIAAALDKVLAQAQVGVRTDARGQEIRLGYAMRRGVIVVSSTRGLRPESVVRVYDVRDLTVAESRQRASRTTISTNSTFGGGDDTYDSWQRVAAGIGKACVGDEPGFGTVCWAGRLVVLQSPESHQRTEEFLARCRRSRPTSWPSTEPQ